MNGAFTRSRRAVLAAATLLSVGAALAAASSSGAAARVTLATGHTAAAVPTVPLRVRLRCTGPRRLCPVLRGRPRLYSRLQGQPVRPLLTGNYYAIATGTWIAPARGRLTVEWLSRRGRVLGRGTALLLPESAAGAAVIARECVHTALATSCATLRAPEAVRTPTAYLGASCGVFRPAAPPYDPNFALLSAPRLAGGFNPCHGITWALDEYGEPPLPASEGQSWQSIVAGAIAQLGEATGIQFVQAPGYSLPPGGRFAPRPAGVDLGIAFAPLEPDVGGLGGPIDSRGQFTTSAGVEIAATEPWNVPEATNVLLHELGHAMGLGHPVAEPPATDPLDEVMDPTVTRFTAYRPGDLCGLYEVVWRRPCAGARAVTLGQGVVPQGSGHSSG